MSKLFITNSDSAFAHTISVNQDFFPKYSTFSTEECSAVFYEKKNYSLGNVYRDEAGNFIGIVGTYLYKECFGAEAARRILADFDGDIVRMKKEVQGMFSALIYKAGQMVVFNDYYGLYDTFYHVDKDGRYVIATSLKDLLLEISSITINEFPFMMEIFHAGCFDKETSFKDVNKLLGTEYLSVIDGQVCLHDFPKELYRVDVPAYESVNEAVDYLIDKIVYYTSCIRKGFEHVAIGMTGGLDSRTVLASYMKADGPADLTLLYGEGNSLLTPTCKEDKFIVEQLSRALNFSVYYMNWRHPEATEVMDWQYQQDLVARYGFLNRLYCGNKNFFEEFEKNVARGATFLDFGYFLEASRLREWAEVHVKKTFSLDQFVDAYYCNESLSLFYDRRDDFCKYVHALLDRRMYGAYPESQIPIDGFERLRWNTARYSDSRLYQLLNCCTYTFPVFGVPVIHEYLLNLPADVTRDAKFQVQLLNVLNPGILQVPIFSHRRKFHIAQDGSKRMDVNLKNMMTRILNEMPFLKSFVLSAYRRVKYRDYLSNYAKVQQQLGDLQTAEIKEMINVGACPNDSHIRSLYCLRQFLLAYQVVRKAKVE